MGTLRSEGSTEPVEIDLKRAVESTRDQDTRAVNNVATRLLSMLPGSQEIGSTLEDARQRLMPRLVRADSLRELAERIGVPAAGLEATVERYNGFCASGVDEDFGRGDDEYDTFFAGGQGPNPALTPCDRAPFYAARFVLSDLGTKGGLVTDERARVLREDGTHVPGLYATSNSAASVFGAVYPGPGAPLGSAMVFASLAVQDVLGS